ncbi:MAG: PIN domain-containing protein [Candidatus Latescibacteria bacterium]|nr:PIN domain-containing protein [Candidatus Latescibacterota bacterium]
MRVYLDNSVYNRPFDDQSQPRIWIETLAFSLVLHLIEAGDLQLIASSVVGYENLRNPFPERREWVDRCLTLAKYSQPVNEKIRDRARELEKQGLRSMDALHLACAEAAETDCFLTYDDRIVKRYKGGKVQVLNPVEFILVVTAKREARNDEDNHQ